MLSINLDARGWLLYNFTPIVLLVIRATTSTHWSSRVHSARLRIDSLLAFHLCRLQGTPLPSRVAFASSLCASSSTYRL